MTAAKLLDFGLAKLARHGERPALVSETHGGDGGRSTHRPRHDPRHAAVHGAGAAGREGGRRAHRPVGARRDRLRDADGPAGVRGREPGELDRQHHERGAASTRDNTAADAACARSRRHEVPGEAPGRSLGHRARRGRRAALDWARHQHGHGAGRACSTRALPEACLGGCGRAGSLLGRRRPDVAAASAHSVRAASARESGRAPGRGAERRRRNARVPVHAGGIAYGVRVDPDGQALVFVGRRDGVQQLYVRRLDAAEARPLAGTEGAQVPAVSRGRPVGGLLGARRDQEGAVRLAARSWILRRASRIRLMAWSGTQVARCGSARRRLQRPPHLADPARWEAYRRDDGRRRGIAARPALSLPGGTAVLFTVRKRLWSWGDEDIVAHTLATGTRKVAPHGCRRRAVPANGPPRVPAARDSVRRPVRRRTAGGSGPGRGRPRHGRAGVDSGRFERRDRRWTLRRGANRHAGVDSCADCAI